MDGLNILQDLYLNYTGSLPDEISSITKSGSNRQYFRLTGVESLVGVIGTCIEENQAFLYLDSHFKSKDLPVPKVVAIDKSQMAYLQQDLGNLSLFDAIENSRKTGIFSNQDKDLLVKTIRYLPDFQFVGAKGLDFKYCYPTECFDKRLVMWDLNYFKYCFLKGTGVEFNEAKLEDDFETLSKNLLSEYGSTFMYRDFQSRNIMLVDGNPWFIDFQGGRKGPIYYDVASFLWQAKAQFTDELRKELIKEYLASLAKYRLVKEEAFWSQLKHFVLFRILQTLGAYGFRGYFEKKSHFIQSIPYALNNLRAILPDLESEYPYLTLVLKQLTERELSSNCDAKKLTVRVSSFAFKNGIPTDKSGNGGGFVFDCRALHNPGRYDEYKQLNGLDQPVIEFLEKHGEVYDFMKHCNELVDASVERYIKRGFTNLMVSFGCTGGQHRSVYCAQQLALHLKEKYDVIVELEHKEQNIKTSL